MITAKLKFSELTNSRTKKVTINIVESVKFKKLFENRRSRVKDGVATPVQLEEVELVSTEEVMKEILRSAKQQPIKKSNLDFYKTTFASKI